MIYNEKRLIIARVAVDYPFTETLTAFRHSRLPVLPGWGLPEPPVFSSTSYVFGVVF
jgi:hypothetical protein